MLNKPFHTRKRKELEPQIASALSLLEQSKSFSNKEGYVLLLASDNPALFEAITDLAFFDFQSTNIERAIVGYHQVVLYLHRGIWAWRYKSNKVIASGKTECHHLDSNPSNNNIDNLVYVTPQQNKLCANAVHSKYLGQVTSACIEHWSDFGNSLMDTANLIRLTIIRTFQGMGIDTSDIPKAAYFFFRLPRYIGKEIIKHWSLQWTKAKLEPA